MSQTFLGFFKNPFSSSAEQQIKNTQNHSNNPPANFRQSPIQIENYDDILLQSIHSDESNQEEVKYNKKIQNMKDQNSKEKSSQSSKSSGSYEDLSKQNKQAKYQQGLNQENEINIRETFDFSEDLNQSIRQSGNANKYSQYKFVSSQKDDIENLYNMKKPNKPEQYVNKPQKKIQHKEQNQIRQSFSDLNQNNEGQDIRGTFSDLNQQNIQNFKDQNINQENIRGSFSDLNEYQNEDNTIKETIEPKGNFSKIKSKKVYFEESKYDNTIDLLGDPYQVTESKLNLQQIKREKEYFNEVKKQQKIQKYQQMDQQIDLGKSMFTQRMQRKNFNKVNIANSPSKNSTPNKSQKKQITEQEKQYQKQVNLLNQSHYMKVISQQKPKKTLKDQKPALPQSNQNYFKIDLRDKYFFICYQNQKQRHINQKLIQNITEHFLILNIMLPFFNFKLYNDLIIQTQSLYLKKSTEQLFLNYTNIYFDFLIKRYPNQLKTFFSDQKHLKSSVESQSALKKDQSTAVLGTIFKKLTQYLKYSNYSKPQILKKALQSQLQFLKQIECNWCEDKDIQLNNGEKDIKQTQFNRKQSNSKSRLEEKSKTIRKQIADLQLLISFEGSESYCREKVKQKLQENIWNERKRKLIEDRNWYITNMFQSCYI